MRVRLKQGESLTAVLSGAAATTNPHANVEWAEGSTQDSTGLDLSGATAVTLLSAPNAVGRTLTGLSIYNADTASVTVTVSHVVSGVSSTILKVTLGTGYTLIVDASGVRVVDASGQQSYLSIQSLTSNLAFTGALTTTDGVTAGTARKIGGLAYASTAASTAITGAQEAETNFDTKYTLPANTLKAGTVVRIRAWGIHTATTGSETHTMLLKLGATTLASVALIDPANGDVFSWDFVIQCRTAGASGTIVGNGEVAFGAPDGASAGFNAVNLGSTVFDTTAAADIAVAIDRQASATDSDSARLDGMIVEVLG